MDRISLDQWRSEQLIYKMPYILVLFTTLSCEVTNPTRPVKMTTTSLPPTFLPLASQISLYTPPSPSAGELVILCTWLGAQRKHIAKYIAVYHAIAPSTRILLIESSIRSITSSYPSQQRAILPAVEVVRSVLAESTTTKAPRILLHTFSNGGPNAATQLLIVLREQTSAPLPLIGTICDSGPAAGEYWRNYNAMLLSLPPGIWRIIGIPIVHFILIGVATSTAMGRFEKLEHTIRKTLIGEEYVCGENRICYVYSKTDQMTYWEDVVTHAQTARGLGWSVDEWEVEGTEHCGHFRGNEKQYAEKMKGMWEGRREEIGG
jgi:hypothetical protein